MYRFIHNPGRAKLRRWSIALHEAAHAVAYQKIGEVWARAYIFRDGSGLCVHGLVADLAADAVCVAVAKYAQHAPGWAYNPPTIRPRGTRVKPGIRRPRCKLLSDEKFLATAVRLTELEYRGGQRKHLPLDAAEIERDAQLFVERYGNARDILELARRLYRDGEARPWPIKKTQNKTACGIVPAGQQPHYPIAASAAKGNSDAPATKD